MGILQIYDTGFGLKLVDPETSETGGSTGAVTLDLTSSRNFDITAAGAITYTFANPPSGKRLTTTFKLVLENGGTGTQTWPASVTWLSGSAPTLKASGINILQFTTTNGGTTWLGSDITPATSLSITATSLTSTGFTLDPSVATEISFWAFRTTAMTGDLRFQYSNNAGATWTSFTGNPVMNFATTINPVTPPALKCNFSFIYYNSIWHSVYNVNEMPSTSSTSGANLNSFQGRTQAFVPSATTIYRLDFNQAGWTFSQPIVSQG